MDLRRQLSDFEGFRNEAYPDPLTRGAPWTIGVGHTGPEVFEGLVWSDDKVNQVLDADIASKLAQCRREFPWFDSLNEPRQAVVVGMCFQIGMGRRGDPAKGVAPTGLLAFVNTLGAMRGQRWADAAEGMRRSTWAKQTPRRAARLARQMETGEWN